MPFTSSFSPRRAHLLVAGLLLLAGSAAATADTYDPSDKQLNIPSMVIGNATFSTVIVTPETILCVGGGAPDGLADTYVPQSGQLFIPAVTVAGAPYSNVLISVTGGISIGGVSGADIYNGVGLIIPSVQVKGGQEYKKVTVKVAAIISAGGGMPGNVEDVYDPKSRRLTIAAVQVGSKVYTNAIVTVAQIVSVGSSPAAMPVAHTNGGGGAVCSINQLDILSSTLPGPSLNSLFVPIGGAGYISVILVNQSSQDMDSVTVSASTGATTLPVTIAMCQTALNALDCPVSPTPTITIPEIAPAQPPDDLNSPLVLLRVTASAPIASSAANKITITFTDPGGTVVGTDSVPVSASVPPVGIAVATAGGNGIVDVPVGGQGAFIVATENQGAKLTDVTVSASTNLPVTVTLCQTNPGSGQCLAAPGASVTLPSLAAGATPTFSFFVSAPAALSGDPAANLIFINFEDSAGTPVGSASVEVATTE